MSLGGGRYTVLDLFTARDNETGTVYLITEVFQRMNEPTVTQVDDNVQNVVGVDEKRVTFELIDVDGRILPADGFLIEVYESGSDGNITKLGRETVKNPVDDEEVEPGFDPYLELDVDG
jgi:hypothetical protein